MKQRTWEIVGQDDQQLPFEKTIGDALRGLIRKRWKNNAAKALESRWRIDPKTAKNVVQRGCVSERTLTAAAQAEGWDLWVAMGEEMFGLSYEQHLESLIHEQRQAAERAAARADYLRRLEERARRVVDDSHGAVSL